MLDVLTDTVCMTRRRYLKMDKVKIYMTMFQNVWTLTKGQLCANSGNDIWRSMRINQGWVCTSRCIHKDKHICVHRNFI